MHKHSTASKDLASFRAVGKPRAVQQPRAEAAEIAPPIGAGGRALDAATRGAMEARFAHDFSRVRVHTGPEAAASARAVSALAYTVGNHIVFGDNQLKSDHAGRRLLAHELAHVVQQGGRGEGRPQAKLKVSQAGDLHERQADAAAERVMAGAQVGVLTPAAPSIQRDGPPAAAAKPEEKPKEASEEITKGVEKLAEEALKNEAFKLKVLEPLKLRLKGGFSALPTGDKAAVVGFGVATAGVGGAALASSGKGPELLQDKNLAAPFTLIPYWPLVEFKYKLPTGDTPELRQYKFDTVFDVSELLNIRTKRKGLQPMSFKVNMQWSFDPQTEKLGVFGANASLGLGHGLSLSGGLYQSPLPPLSMPPVPGGFMGRSDHPMPSGGALAPVPDMRFMINLDLMKFNPALFGRQIRSFFTRD